MTVVNVKVLRSSRKPDTYLYLPEDGDYDELPDALRDQFGEATEFLQFELSPSRQLAQADSTQVLTALARQGFYLQLPPKDQP
ncbi:MAG: YcgL domain-containing protein [Pseudomonadota bacterium]